MEWTSIEPSALIAYILGIALVCFIGKMFLLPIRLVWKFLYNGIVGGILLWIVNLAGAYVEFHIGINIITALIAGFLGIPGVILLIAATFLF